jgi:hypothetical protein
MAFLDAPAMFQQAVYERSIADVVLFVGAEEADPECGVRSAEYRIFGHEGGERLRVIFPLRL